MIDRDGITHYALTACPYCGHKLNAAGASDGSHTAPSDGDATVCIECAEVMFFQQDMTVRKAKEGELMTMLFSDPAWAAEIAATQRRIRSLPPG